MCDRVADFFLHPSSGASPHPSAERRLACVLFADVVNSTGLAHALPLEIYGALMTETLQLLMLACSVRGGEVLPSQGDAVVALWPEAETNSALETALELPNRVANLALASALQLKLKLRTGLASGEVRRGLVGGAVTAYGLPINLSRRLCDLAEPGKLVTCERTVSTAPEAFFSPLPPLPLQGFPVARAWQLMAPPASPHMKSG